MFEETAPSALREESEGEATRGKRRRYHIQTWLLQGRERRVQYLITNNETQLEFRLHLYPKDVRSYVGKDKSVLGRSV